jgi:hypothetical protein
MLSTQHQQFQPRTDISLDHERRGRARRLTVAEREEAARGLEVLGYDEDARRLRDENDRITRRAQIAAVPDDPRRPLKSTADRPILVAIDGDQTPATAEDHRSAHMLRMARVAEDGAAAEWATPAERAAFAASARRCRQAAHD